MNSLTSKSVKSKKINFWFATKFDACKAFLFVCTSFQKCFQHESLKIKLYTAGGW